MKMRFFSAGLSIAILAATMEIPVHATSRFAQGLREWNRGLSRDETEAGVAGTLAGRERERLLFDFWEYVIAARPPQIEWNLDPDQPDAVLSMPSLDFRRYEPLLYRDLHQLLAGDINHEVWEMRTAQWEEIFYTVSARAARWYRAKEATKMMASDRGLVENAEPGRRWSTADFPQVRSSIVIEAEGTSRAFVDALHRTRTGVARRFMKARADRIEILLAAQELSGRVDQVASENRNLRVEWDSARWLTDDTMLLWPPGMSRSMKARLFHSGTVEIHRSLAIRAAAVEKLDNEYNVLRDAATRAARDDAALLNFTPDASRETFQDYAPELFEAASAIQNQLETVLDLEKRAKLLLRLGRTIPAAPPDPLAILHELIVIEDILRRHGEIRIAEAGDLRSAFDKGYRRELLEIRAEIPARYERAVLKRLTKEKSYSAPATFDEMRARAGLSVVSPVKGPAPTSLTPPPETGETPIVIVVRNQSPRLP